MGQLLMGRKPTHEQDVARFWSKVQIGSGCHTFRGSDNGSGYQKIYWKGKARYAHRVALELAGVVLPEGMDVDHLCKNHACVRVDHLEIVTHEENCLRGDSGPVHRARHAEVTHCPKGHPYTPENTKHLTAGKDGRYRTRACRECARESTRAWRARMKEA